MSDALLVAIISFMGTAIGTLCGMVANNKMVMYRIEELEKTFKEVRIVERLSNLEHSDDLTNNRISKLEKETSRIVSDIKELKNGI